MWVGLLCGFLFVFGNTKPCFVQRGDDENESCLSRDMHEGVMSHIWIRHVSHMKESCRTYECTRSHIWTSHVSTMTYVWMSDVLQHGDDLNDKWVMFHIWTRHVPRINESCPTYEWVMAHVRVRQVAYTNESCHTYEWVISHTAHECVNCTLFGWGPPNVQYKPLNFQVHIIMYRFHHRLLMKT